MRRSRGKRVDAIRMRLGRIESAPIFSSYPVPVPVEYRCTDQGVRREKVSLTRVRTNDSSCCTANALLWSFLSRFAEKNDMRSPLVGNSVRL